jgi:hypothetical protein
MRCSGLIWLNPVAPSTSPLAASTTIVLWSLRWSHSASRFSSQSRVSAIV